MKIRRDEYDFQDTPKYYFGQNCTVLLLQSDGKIKLIKEGGPSRYVNVPTVRLENDDISKFTTLISKSVNTKHYKFDLLMTCIVIHDFNTNQIIGSLIFLPLKDIPKQLEDCFLNKIDMLKFRGQII